MRKLWIGMILSLGLAGVGVARADAPTVNGLRDQGRAIRAMLPLSTEAGPCELVDQQVLNVRAALAELKAGIQQLEEDTATGYRTQAIHQVDLTLEHLKTAPTDCINRLGFANLLMDGSLNSLDTELMLYQYRNRR